MRNAAKKLASCAETLESSVGASAKCQLPFVFFEKTRGPNRYHWFDPGRVSDEVDPGRPTADPYLATSRYSRTVTVQASAESTSQQPVSAGWTTKL